MRQFSGVMAAVCLLLCAATANAQASKHEGGNKAAQAANRIYLVQMLEKPVVSYKGEIPGLPATKPQKGQKIDPRSSEVLSYSTYLDSRHSRAAGAVGAKKVYDYHYTFNGFAAEMTPAQAEAIKGVEGVVNVTKDQLVSADTSSTPTFLGLDAAGGLWSQLGGSGSAGDGIIIGIVDSGIWPENPSFSDRTGVNGNGSMGGKLAYQQIPGWHGKCTPGEKFNASYCNQKLIGAQWFDGAWGGDAGMKTQRPWEYASARDYNGHGDHTASTAGGNHGVVPTGPFSLYGTISGIAPHARIAVYKALWSLQDGSQANGYTSDLVAAIDQAVADGVDVINYSISGTLTDFLDPVQVAYLYAADAGVFVSCSAGNSGPATETVAHPGPWLTTVAAGTHNRSALGTATLGNGASYTGASMSAAVVTAPLIDSVNAGRPGADPTAVRLCYAAIDNGGTPVLDPAKVAGRIVVCDRGNNARVNKSLAVMEARGVGMILVNPSNNSLNADVHSVPTVHLQNTDYAAVHGYAGTVGPTATINKAYMDYSTPAPYTASFSSRGPLLAGEGNLLKPDVMAPGQDILAAVAPPGNGGLNYNLYSGTSMSSPHVAGVAALLKDLHPDWSPMMIKSALMTSAGDILDAASPSAIIFRQGAGFIAPNKAADPGLVFDSGWNDWLAFLCGTTNEISAGTCNALAGLGYSLDPRNLNTPSIAIGSLPGVQTVTRKVTNVGGGNATYTASVSGMDGFTVVVSPSTLTLGRGETKSFNVSFTTTTAALNDYTGGQLTWSDGTHNVRIPLVAKPVALSAPAEVSGSGGAIGYNVGFGYAGPFSATARGLVPAIPFPGSVAQDPGQSFSPGGPGTVSFNVVVPAGTTYVRFSTFDASVTPGSDLDMYVYRGATLVNYSAGGTAEEQVSLVDPTPDTYTVWIHGYTVPGTANFTLFTWVLGSAPAGNMTVTAPSAATIGGTGGINLSFSGLISGTKYLGSVPYTGASGMPNPTIVRVDVP